MDLGVLDQGLLDLVMASDQVGADRVADPRAPSTPKNRALADVVWAPRWPPAGSIAYSRPMRRSLPLALFALVAGCDSETYGPGPSEPHDPSAVPVTNLVYEGGVFRATARSLLLRSSDGRSWTFEPGDNPELRIVDFAGGDVGGVEIAVARDRSFQSSLLIRDDSWEPVAADTEVSTHAYGVAFGNGTFVVAARARHDVTDVLVTTDGERWLRIAVDVVWELDSWVSFAGDRFYLHGEGGDSIASSVDGIDWQIESLGPTSWGVVSVVTDPAGGVAAWGLHNCCYNEQPMLPEYLERRSDGWYSAVRHDDPFITSMAIGPDRAVAAAGELVVSSQREASGWAWTGVDAPEAAVVDSVAFGGGVFAAATSSGLFVSDDTRTWRRVEITP
jgi:hypothetical protein